MQDTKVPNHVSSTGYGTVGVGDVCHAGLRWTLAQQLYTVKRKVDEGLITAA
jgi:hypothetical protein